MSQFVKAAFGIAVIGFGAYFVATNWHSLREALREASLGWIIASLVLAAAGQWAATFSFRATIRATSGKQLVVIDAARVYYVSQLGKYVPGSIWPIVAVTEMAKRYGISRRAAAVAGVLLLFFSVTTAGLLGVVLLALGVAHSHPELLWLLLVLPVGLVMLHPRLLTKTINALLRLTRRAPIGLKLDRQAIAGVVGWSGVSWALLGLHCWTLVVGLGGPTWTSLLAASGGFLLAYAAGTLFVPAPGGAGVREAVLGVALSDVISQAGGFQHAQIFVVVLLSRLLLTFLDFTQAGVALVAARSAARARSR